MRASTFFFLLLAGWMLTVQADAAQEPVYEIIARYDAEHRQIEGTAELTLVPTTPTIYLYLMGNLDLDPNPYLSPRQIDARYPFGFEPTSTLVFTVERVQSEGWTPVPFRLLRLPPAWQTYSLAETVLAVDLPRSTAASGGPLTLRLSFITDVPRTSLGDEGITSEVLTWRFGWFPTLLPEQEGIVEESGTIGYAERASFPLMFPWATYRATLVVPEPYEVYTGADRMETSGEREASDKEYVASYESPSRSLALTIAEDYERYTLEGAIPIDVVYFPGHQEEARWLATLAIDILAEYEARFGPYPRSRLVLVENPNLDGRSFAADGIVWLSTRFFTHRHLLLSGALDRITEYVLAHEIAHQWVGLGTGIDLDTEAWLSEGLAQYLAVGYFERRYGAFEPNLFELEVPGLAEEFVERQFGFYNLREHFIELPYLLTQRIGFDEALIKPLDKVQFSNVSDVRLYDKGYLVARSIAATIGEEAFERGLKRAITERRADVLDARTLQILLEEETGVPLDEVFDVWLFGPGSVDYGIRIVSRSQSGGTHETTVLVTRDGGAVQPVEVEVLLSSGATVRRQWDGDQREARLVFRTPSRVVRATVDPEHRHPDRDRLNNNAPVKIVGAVSKSTLPLDAYVLAPDPKTGGLILSHLDRFQVAVSQAGASAEVHIGRHHRLVAAVSLATLDLLGSFAYTYTAYAQPETGSPATYWERDIAYTFAVNRLLSDGEPLALFRLAVEDLASMTAEQTRTLSIDVTPTGAGRLAVSTYNELRLFPNVYLQGGAQIGLGFGALPETLQFRIGAIHCSSPPASMHVLSGTLALEVPDMHDLPYNLLNLAMVDRLRARLFLAGGAGWKALDEFSTTSPRIETGIEQIVELSTLGGLLPLTVRFGVATPIVGGGTTVFYARIAF